MLVLAAASPRPGALLDFHHVWGLVVIVGNGIAGCWALAAWRVASLRTRALWWFTLFVEAAVFVQVASGLGLVEGEGLRPPAFHPFYGFLAVVVVGFLYAYRNRLRPRLYLLYGLGGLFLMGIGVRALVTAG
ncbi:MAG TPA: hypothetical protein VKV23_01040 [Acidimicrobiales bacterium]|nr:hypothetical protein [Acidimicrobiales bacterium]